MVKTQPFCSSYRQVIQRAFAGLSELSAVNWDDFAPFTFAPYKYW